ncbi:MAG: hypothetical protein JO186_03990 [Actinobacteria bacterium]|nr:hypothetical protein [Actinomycetota bacterium]
MKLLLRIYPRRWRERYGDELLALLEAEPLTWRVRADVVASGLRERLCGTVPPQGLVLWAWSVFVIGGMGFQKTSEHWQVVVAANDRAVPTVAFDVVQAAAAIGSAAVLAGVTLALPSFVRDLRSGGWSRLRRPILIASATTLLAAAALVAVALHHDIVAASIFVVSAVFSLFAWTHAAALAARRVAKVRAHAPLALTVVATMIVMMVGAAVWFAAVNAHAPSFVGAAQLAVTATFMLAGTALATTGVRSLRA